MLSFIDIWNLNLHVLLQKMKGVIAFYTAEDVPGRNVFAPANAKETMIDYDEVVSGIINKYFMKI